MWTIETAGPDVDAELEVFDDLMLAHLSRIRRLLELHGLAALRMPLARPLKHGLWELRLSGQGRIGRTIYLTLSGKRIVLLRAFIKKTQKTPAREIEIAWERAKRIMI
jgi:phage-related protein